ncbi:PAS domain S-box protein [Pelagerythrobacter marensis]|uniref:histidine kinase n=1 Tax=Pelagerythrobacter marensis TaxID=543877 RepID=A0A0G3X909_9SPHN|nr:PAS domain S-box protein [Pelagerythrobacter marensis]AKM07089.1 Signal transduction histidine kinase [Pelagerythrobacter marensis]
MQGQPDTFRDAHLAAIVNHSSDAIVSKDLNGIVMSWNAAAERLFDIPAADMIGNSIRRIIPADRQGEEDAILARVRGGELVPKFETMRLRADGTLIPVAITVSPIRDAEGTIIGASKIANDLREQATLRAELLQSRQRFEALANNIPQLAWMADREGWLFWYNQRWYDYTGTTLDEMQGWGWRAVHHPDHVDRVVEHVQRSWDTGEPWTDTFPLRGKDGDYRWFLTQAQPLRDDNGEVILWCGTNTDITEERETNERIRLLMNEVNHRSRNIMATIQAIIQRTVGDSDPDLVDALTRRISALSANQDLLTSGNWIGVTVADIAQSQILHVSDISEGRVEFDGPDDVKLKPAAAEALGLAIHELATNAAKYGALSNAKGRVALRWRVEERDGAAMLDLEWRERDGPPVVSPTRSGFGTTIIKRNPAMAMRAQVTLDYAPDGVVWRVLAPADVLATAASKEALQTGD